MTSGSWQAAGFEYVIEVIASFLWREEALGTWSA
jgi:hypothetical protein